MPTPEPAHSDRPAAQKEGKAARLLRQPIRSRQGLAGFKLNGETRITIVSDNNYRPEFQRTLLLQFALKK